MSVQGSSSGSSSNFHYNTQQQNKKIIEELKNKQKAEAASKSKEKAEIQKEKLTLPPDQDIRKRDKLRYLLAKPSAAKAKAVFGHIGNFLVGKNPSVPETSPFEAANRVHIEQNYRDIFKELEFGGKLMVPARNILNEKGLLREQLEGPMGKAFIGDVKHSSILIDPNTPIPGLVTEGICWGTCIALIKLHMELGGEDTVKSFDKVVDAFFSKGNASVAAENQEVYSAILDANRKFISQLEQTSHVISTLIYHEELDKMDEAFKVSGTTLSYAYALLNKDYAAKQPNIHSEALKRSEGLVTGIHKYLNHEIQLAINEHKRLEEYKNKQLTTLNAKLEKLDPERDGAKIEQAREEYEMALENFPFLETALTIDVKNSPATSEMRTDNVVWNFNLKIEGGNCAATHFFNTLRKDARERYKEINSETEAKLNEELRTIDFLQVFAFQNQIEKNLLNEKGMTILSQDDAVRGHKTACETLFANLNSAYTAAVTRLKEKNSEIDMEDLEAQREMVKSLTASIERLKSPKYLEIAELKGRLEQQIERISKMDIPKPQKDKQLAELRNKLNEILNNEIYLNVNREIEKVNVVIKANSNLIDLINDAEEKVKIAENDIKMMTNIHSNYIRIGERKTLDGIEAAICKARGLANINVDALLRYATWDLPDIDYLEKFNQLPSGYYQITFNTGNGAHAILYYKDINGDSRIFDPNYGSIDSSDHPAQTMLNLLAKYENPQREAISKLYQEDKKGRHEITTYVVSKAA